MCGVKMNKIIILSLLLLSLHFMVCTNALASERHAVAAGEYHSLFIDKNGIVWGWGYRNGLGLASDQTTPQIVFEKAVSVAASRCSIALDEDGTVWGRGINDFCQLGRTPFSASPRKVFDDVIALGVGPNTTQTFVIKPDRSLWGWGWRGENFDRDNGEKAYDSCLPQRILDNVEQVAMGSEHTLALVRTDPATNGGKALQLMGWGSNDCWQLGEYDLGDQTTPVPINPWNDENILNGMRIVKVAAAGPSYALMEDGTIWSWGDLNRAYCDPLKGVPEDPETRRLEGMDNVTDISAGRAGVLALRADGTLWGRFWHLDTSLETENIIRANHDHWAFILDNVQEMAAGSFHGIALKKDGTVWTWGNNNRGQLGRSKVNDYTTPIQVVFPSPEETAIELKKFREKMKADQQ